MAATAQKTAPEKKQWFGPFVGDFTFVADETEFVKYHCALPKGEFEFPMPRTMFSWEFEKLPPHVRVALAPSAESVAAYFERVRKNHPEQTLNTSACVAFNYVDEKHKVRNYVAADNPALTLAIPREVFSGKQEPPTLHIGIGELS